MGARLSKPASPSERGGYNGLGSMRLRVVPVVVFCVVAALVAASALIPQVTPESAAQQLAELGYFKFTPLDQHEQGIRELTDSLRQHRIVGTETDESEELSWGRDRRMYHADNEDLAEGSIGELLLEMKPVLTKEGVRLDSVEDLYEADAYDLIINGQRIRIRDKTDPLYEDNPGAMWSLAAKALLEITNQLLMDAGSSERLYGIGGGHDAWCILLTAEMHDLLRAPELGYDEIMLPYPPQLISADGKMSWPPYSDNAPE